MKVKDFIKMEIDVDVYDDVTEELGIAFCGPIVLTDEGAEKFAEVMDYDIHFARDLSCAIIEVDDKDERTWKHKLRKASEFFYGAAGYCDADDFEKWFKED